jgi:hypothetical protein
VAAKLRKRKTPVIISVFFIALASDESGEILTNRINAHRKPVD